MNGNSFRKMLAAGGVLAAVCAGSALTAYAAGGLDMHTDYPGMTAKA